MVLFSIFSGSWNLDKGRNYLAKARALKEESLAEKSLYYQKALKMMSSAIKSNPFSAEPCFESGEIMSEIAQNPDIMKSTYNKIIKFSLQDAKEYYAEAEKEYLGAILRNPTNSVYHQRLGDVYWKQSNENQDSAEKEFRKAVLLDPYNANIHLYLSKYYFLNDKEPEFIKHINQAIELSGLAFDGSAKGQVYGFLKSIGRLDLIKK
jgi:tetratricopeptide (TPR) repeat protein